MIKLEDYDYIYNTDDSINNNLSPIQNNILNNRLNKEYDYEKYLENSFDIFKDIKDLADIKLASELLLKHIQENKHILICSDLDCDGLTSAVMAYKSLTEVFQYSKEKISVIINRRKDGNSFNPKLVQRVKDLHKKKKIDLMISFDQGSRNEKEYQDFKSLEHPFKIIITDHHTIDYDNYPKSVDAFINPQRKDSKYTRNISGCTVGFLVMIYTYFLNKKNDLSVFYPIFPFPAISVISDVMSCKEPVNRYIYRIGVNELNKLQDNLFVTLRSILNIGGVFTDTDIKMKLAPFINAANRMGLEDLGYEMLATEDKDICRENAVVLEENNNIKKDLTKQITKEVLVELGQTVLDGGYAFKIHSTAAVNGIIAVKIGELKKVPTICFMESSGESLSGSCRAILKGFDLLECLNQIHQEDKELIIQYGGHKDACGVHIHKDKFERFKFLFYKKSKELIQSLNIDPRIRIDYFLKGNECYPDVWNEVLSLAPYGKDFEEPIFVSELTLNNVIIMGTFCRLSFFNKTGQILSGFYSFQDTLGLTIDNIKENLVRDKYLVSYTLNLSTYKGSYDFNFNFLKIDRIKK